MSHKMWNTNLLHQATNQVIKYSRKFKGVQETQLKKGFPTWKISATGPTCTMLENHSLGKKTPTRATKTVGTDQK